MQQLIWNHKFCPLAGNESACKIKHTFVHFWKRILWLNLIHWKNTIQVSKYPCPIYFTFTFPLTAVGIPLVPHEFLMCLWACGCSLHTQRPCRCLDQRLPGRHESKIREMHDAVDDRGAHYCPSVGQEHRALLSLHLRGSSGMRAG